LIASRNFVGEKTKGECRVVVALDFFGTLTPGQRVTLALTRGSTSQTVTLIAVEMPPEYVERWKRNRDIAKQRANAQHQPVTPRPPR
jgi:hypothetical protein